MASTGFNEAEFYPGSPFEFFGLLNFMKAGISFADLVTTVSETYAREIRESGEYGYGLEGVLRNRGDRTDRNLNGIDYETWNPETDPLFPPTTSDFSGQVRGKPEGAPSEFGLDNRPDRPVMAMISTHRRTKGFDLLVAILDDLLAEEVYFVLLGSGNKETESALHAIVERHRDRACSAFVYDNDLAHLIEAGADIFLMPSKYEPCGLNQMYSMRYGTVPVVRATGGLADTVQRIRSGNGRGDRLLVQGIRTRTLQGRN